MLKKKGFLVLLFALVCLLSVGCGKDDEKDGKGKKEEKASVKTLECTGKDSDAEVTMVIKQDQKTYKFTEISMTMVGPKEDLGSMSDADIEKLVCSDDSGEYKSCKVKSVGDKLQVNMEFDLDEYEKEVIDDDEYDIDELDENTLTKIKESAEEDNYTCKIS